MDDDDVQESWEEGSIYALKWREGRMGGRDTKEAVQ